jgi:hypothetical protein
MDTMKKKKAAKPKQQIHAKIKSKAELVRLIVDLQRTANDLQARLDIAEAQIANLLSQTAPKQPYWPHWPGGWQWPNWPTYYEVRTEVTR